MILATNDDSYRTTFSNGDWAAVADMPADKGGDGRGFGPHDLLEAALATCIAMTARKYALERHLPVASVRCEVRLDRSNLEKVCIEYDLSLEGHLSPEEDQALREAVGRCPVARTLSSPIALEPRH